MKKIIFSFVACVIGYAKSYVYNDGKVNIFFDDKAIYSISKVDSNSSNNVFKFEFPEIKDGIKREYDLVNNNSILNLLKQNAHKLPFTVSEFQENINYANYLNNEVIKYDTVDMADVDEDRLNSYYRITSQALMYHKEELASFCSFHQEYLGGAHPNYFIKCRNYKNNNILKIDDFIKDKNKFAKLVEQELKKAIKNKKINIFDNIDIFDKQTLFMDNIYFSDNGINVLYQPYEIAPYSEGSICIFISKNNLIDVLKDEFFKFFD